MSKITDIRYIFRTGEWVLANPEGNPGQVGYVYGEANGEYLVHSIYGDVSCNPKYMRRLTPEDILRYMQGLKNTFICRHVDLMEDIPEQLRLL